MTAICAFETFNARIDVESDQSGIRRRTAVGGKLPHAMNLTVAANLWRAQNWS